MSSFSFSAAVAGGDRPPSFSHGHYLHHHCYGEYGRLKDDYDTQQQIVQTQFKNEYIWLPALQPPSVL